MGNDLLFGELHRWEHLAKEKGGLVYSGSQRKHGQVADFSSCAVPSELHSTQIAYKSEYSRGDLPAFNDQGIGEPFQPDRGIV